MAYGIDDLIRGGGAAAGGYFNYKGAKDTNKANRDIARETNTVNAAIAQQQMYFQALMSGTAHQREVRDLRAAGLNPILSMNPGGGASTPSGAGIAAVTGAPQQNELSGAVSSAMDALRMHAELKNLSETNKQISATTSKLKADTLKAHSDTELNRALKVSATEQAKLNASNARVAAQTARNTALIEPRLKNEAEVDNSRYGKVMTYVSRFLPSLLGATNSAVAVGKLLK